MAQRTFTDRYASGLKASVHNNSIAYAFSIMLTAALAIERKARAPTISIRTPTGGLDGDVGGKIFSLGKL